MGGIKAFVVIPIAAFYFSVMSWAIRADELVGDPVLLQMLLKQGSLSRCVVKRFVNTGPLSVWMHSIR